MTQADPEADPTVVAAIVAAGRLWAEQPLAGLAQLPPCNVEFDTAFPVALDELGDHLGDDTETFGRHVFWYAGSDTRPYRDAGGKDGIAFSHLVFIPVSGVQEDVDALLNDPVERQRVESAFMTCGLISKRGVFTLLDSDIGLTTLVSLDPSRFRRALQIGIGSRDEDPQQGEPAPELACAPSPVTRFDMLAELVKGAPSERRTFLGASCLVGLVQERWPADTDPATIPNFTELVAGQAGTDWIEVARGGRKAFLIESPTGPMEAAARMICGQISHQIVIAGVGKNIDVDQSADQADVYVDIAETAIVLTYGQTVVGPIPVSNGFVDLAMNEIEAMLLELSDDVSWHMHAYGSETTALQ